MNNTKEIAVKIIEQKLKDFDATTDEHLSKFYSKEELMKINSEIISILIKLNKGV